MRIQPHVWKSPSLRFEEYASDVLRDAITTHGHPIGFCGAIFHAMCVAHALASGELPGPREWMGFVEGYREIANVVSQDEQLGVFWIGPWQEGFGQELATAVATEAKRTISLIQSISGLIASGPGSCLQLLERLGGFEDATKGSGANTALAAAAAAYFGRQMPPSEVLQLGPMLSVATQIRLPQWLARFWGQLLEVNQNGRSKTETTSRLKPSGWPTWRLGWPLAASNTLIL